MENVSRKFSYEQIRKMIKQEKKTGLASLCLGGGEAVSMIVNGFCREVFRELPMEFAVEAQKLLSISLEGSVG